MKELQVFVYIIVLTIFPAVAWTQTGALSSEGLVEKLSDHGLGQIESRFAESGGVVLKITESKLFISNDTGAIPAVGSVLEIVRYGGEEVKHPETGEMLGAITEPVGKVKVVGADAKLITAIPMDKNSGIKIGDNVASPSSDGAKTALIMNLAMKSWPNMEVKEALLAKVAGWANVSLIAGPAIDRFIYDRKIDNLSNITTKENLTILHEDYGADYLIYIDLSEDGDVVLSDIVLYDLADKAAEPDVYKELIKTSSIESVKEPAQDKPIVVEKEPSPPSTAEPIVNNPEPKPAGDIPSGSIGIGQSREYPVTGPIAEFDEMVTALASVDFDGDQIDEIVVGYEHGVAVFKLENGVMSKIWSKKLGASKVVVGLCAGDFNKNGKPEIYINNIVSTRFKSMVLEHDGDSFTTLLERQPLYFYAGGDGKLYGQDQKKFDGRFGDNISQITWTSSGLEATQFKELPKRSQMSGLAFADLDGDGATDIVGYDRNKNLLHYSGARNTWREVRSGYGGSNISSLLYSLDDIEEYQQVVTPVVVGSGSYVIALSNHSSFEMISNPVYKEGSLGLFTMVDGALAEKYKTNREKGAIQGMVMLDNDDGFVLVSRSYFSFFGKARSELSIVRLDNR